MLDLLTSLIPALVAVIPSYFLYRQSERAGVREAADRKQARELDAERQNNELQARHGQSEAEAREADEARRRERAAALEESVFKFTSAVQRLRLHRLYNAALVYGQDEDEDLQVTISENYERAMLSDNHDLRVALKWLMDTVEEIYARPDDDRLTYLLRTAQDELDGIRNQMREMQAKNDGQPT